MATFIDTVVSTHEVAVDIVDRVEDVLEAHKIVVPDDDRPAGNTTPFYGVTYGDLLSEIEEILISMLNATARENVGVVTGHFIDQERPTAPTSKSRLHEENELPFC